MGYEWIGIAVLWLFLYGYVIVASIDFGAGFYSFYSLLTREKHAIHPIIERYLSPVWEVTNVFLIFLLVGIVGFFPDTAYYFGTALLVPGSIAVILLAIRGSFYAFHSANSHPVYPFLYGLTGLLIPASLSVVLTISEGGFIRLTADGRVELLYEELFWSPFSWSVVVLAIVSVLFISAAFLTYYASRAGDERALKVLRRYALGWSGPTLLSSLFIFSTLRQHNPDHFHRMLEYGWMFGLSFLCFLLAVVLIWRKRAFGWAFSLVMAQFFFAFFGYGVSHLPYLLYPYLTVQDSVNNPTMTMALTIAFQAGLLLLVPSLVLLLRLFLFDAKYVRGQ